MGRNLQAEVLAFIKSEQARIGVSPTYREIGAHVGIKHPSVISRAVGGLIARGALVRLPGYSRSLEVVSTDKMSAEGHVAAAMAILTRGPRSELRDEALCRLLTASNALRAVTGAHP